MNDTSSPAERARHYRSRAEELRTIASEWMDSGIREMLGGLAKTYEHMAEQIENLYRHEIHKDG